MSVKKIQNMRRRGSFETLLLCKTSKVGMHERHFERLGINHVSPFYSSTLHTYIIGTLDIIFHQITTFIKVRVAIVFGLQTLLIIDFSRKVVRGDPGI